MTSHRQMSRKNGNILTSMQIDNSAKTSADTYYKCKKCGDEIYWNTHKNYTSCKCGALAIDGCEDYVRINGDKKNWEIVEK